MIMSLTLELLEIMTLAYEQAEEWEVIGHLLTNQLSISFISIQMVLGGLIPFILLMIVVVMGRYMDDRIRNTLAMVASLLLLMQVFPCAGTWSSAARCSPRACAASAKPTFRGCSKRRALLAAAVIFVLPFILLAVFDRLIPTFSSVVDDGSPSPPMESPGTA